MTFSIYTGTVTQASVLNIIGATCVDLSEVLNKLPDNVNKEINPEDIRDSVLTAYSTVAFKETVASNSNISYIGIDNGNTDYVNKDVKSKIFIGKRAYSGTYSYSPSYDILTSDILTSDSDIILYNTKIDTVSNNKTQIKILSGTNSSLYTTSPYIQSQVVLNGTYSTLSLDLVNMSPYGDTASVMSFNSEYGTVSVNDIVFPSISDSLTSVTDGKLLQWYNGSLVWGDLTFSATDYVGVTGSQLDIFGSSVNVNDYSLEFTDSSPCPIEFGDIKMGETFNSVSIAEMLRRLIYDYLPPLCSLEILPPYNTGCVEVGSAPSVKLQYSITKRSLPTNTAILSYMIPSNYSPITDLGSKTITGSASGVVITPVTSATTSFSILVSDGTQSATAVCNLVGVYPYFYGFSSLSTITTTGLLSLTKVVETVSDKYLDIYGSGNLYFIYDSDYPDISNIYDEVGNTISASFSLSTAVLSSPTGLWASKEFKVYQWNGVSQIGPPSVSYHFQY